MNFAEYRRRVLDWLWHYTTLGEEHWSSSKQIRDDFTSGLSARDCAELIVVGL